MAARFGEFHPTAERTVFMDNRRIDGAGGGWGGRGKTQALRGGFRGLKLWRKRGWGRSLIWALYKRKRSITNTYTHTENTKHKTHTHALAQTQSRADSLRQSMTFKRKKADIDSITVTPTAIKQLQILKHFSSVPLGVIGTRNCFPLRLLLACSAAALPRDPRLLPPPHNILAVDVKLSMYTCHSQSLYRLPLSLCSKKPSLPYTHTLLYTRSLHSGINSQTMKVPLIVRQWKYHWITQIGASFFVFVCVCVCDVVDIHASVCDGAVDNTAFPAISIITQQSDWLLFHTVELSVCLSTIALFF